MEDPQQESFARLARIVGEDGLAALASATVMVLGLGGVGSNCVVALARGGVGHFILVDHDTVQESNINRQAIAFHSTVGQRKIDVMQAMIADINPCAQVETHAIFLRAEDMPALLHRYENRLDYVVDAIDTVSAKLALAQIADTQRKENALSANKTKVFQLISSMGAANKIHPESLRFADIYETENCPLCRVMRKEARKRGIEHVRVLYSSEHAVRVDAQPHAERRERTELGTMSYLPPLMGYMIAGEVIRNIVGMAGSASE